MTWLNTRDSYGTLSKILHWIIVLMLLMMVGGGLAYTRLELPGLEQANHEMGGKLVLTLALIRLVLRLIAPAPKPMPTHEKWEVGLSHAVHWGLYVVLFLYPLSGWFMVSADGFAETGALPEWLAPSSTGAFWYNLHFAMKWVLLGFVGLHIAGALKHAVLDRDGTLKRMWFGKP